MANGVAELKTYIKNDSEFISQLRRSLACDNITKGLQQGRPASLHGLNHGSPTEGLAKQRPSAIGEFIEPYADHILEQRDPSGNGGENLL